MAASSNTKESSVRELHAEFPPEAIPSRVDGYALKKIPCCFLLQDSEGKNVLKLNETSVLIWELCNGELSVGDMLELLFESFPEAKDNLEKDVFRVLDEFQEEQVITVSNIG